MGKNLKLKVDMSQDKSYQAGSHILFIQHALTEFGIVSFQAQAPLYDYHGDLANKAYRKSFKLHQKVLKLPIEQPSNFRRLDDNMLAAIYQSGNELITNTYLMFEHLSRYMLGHSYLPNQEAIYFSMEDKELKEKLKHIIVDILKKQDLLTYSGYGALFSNWEKIRHSINHPKFKNIYSADKSKWDTVPIAWMVSGKHLDAFHDLTIFFQDLLDEWEGYASKIATPGSIVNMQPVVSGAHTQLKK